MGYISNGESYKINLEICIIYPSTDCYGHFQYTTRKVSLKKIGIDIAYIEGHCHLRNDTRTFKVSRIKSFINLDIGEIIDNNLHVYLLDTLLKNGNITEETHKHSLHKHKVREEKRVKKEAIIQPTRNYLPPSSEALNTVVTEELSENPLPFCEPAPKIDFEKKDFCLTGNFKVYSKKEIKEKLKSINASTKDSITITTDYLVIGSKGSSSYKNGDYGTKTKKALILRKQYKHISIVSEGHFLSELKRSL